MAYADFTLSRLVKQFSLTLIEDLDLYDDVPSIPVRPEFQAGLTETMSLAVLVSTEKARSEFLIAPLLAELWRLADRRIGIHSGVEFTVEPESGLVGVCDFIITQSPEQLFVTAPILMVVEAKNEEMKRGYAQCVAEMLAAQRFNDRENAPLSKTYGAVTIGSTWKFFELDGATVRIDLAEYGIKDIGKILGILLSMASRNG